MKLFWVFLKRRLSRRNLTISSASADRLKWWPVITFSPTLTPNIDLSVHIFWAPLVLSRYLPQTTQDNCNHNEMCLLKLPSPWICPGVPVWFRVPYDVTIKLVWSSWVDGQEVVYTCEYSGIVHHWMWYNMQVSQARCALHCVRWLPMNWRHSLIVSSDRHSKDSRLHRL